MSRILYASSGSEANDANVKLAWISISAAAAGPRSAR